MSFRAALSAEEDEAEIMNRNGHETRASGRSKEQLDRESARDDFRK